MLRTCGHRRTVASDPSDRSADRARWARSIERSRRGFLSSRPWTSKLRAPSIPRHVGARPARIDPPNRTMTRHRQKGLPLVDNPTAAPRSVPPASEPDANAPADTHAGSEPGRHAAAPASRRAREPAATTTTVPPSRPTAEDVALLAFAQSFELTARDLYQAAIDGGSARQLRRRVRDADGEPRGVRQRDRRHHRRRRTAAP